MDNLHVARVIPRLAFGKFPGTMHILVLYFLFADSLVGYVYMARNSELVGEKLAMVVDRLCDSRITDLSGLAGGLAGSKRALAL